MVLINLPRTRAKLLLAEGIKASSSNVKKCGRKVKKTTKTKRAIDKAMTSADKTGFSAIKSVINSGIEKESKKLDIPPKLNNGSKMNI